MLGGALLISQLDLELLRMQIGEDRRQKESDAALVAPTVALLITVTLCALTVPSLCFAQV
jgi:hypothetical protein